MPNRYKTREEALDKGAFYSGYLDVTVRKEVITKAKILRRDIGSDSTRKNVELYVIPDFKGREVGLGVREFYDMRSKKSWWELYLVSKDTGAFIKV